MACMEHTCVDCNWSTFDNTSHGPGVCPKCGGRLQHTFDEINDEDPDFDVYNEEYDD